MCHLNVIEVKCRGKKGAKDQRIKGAKDLVGSLN